MNKEYILQVLYQQYMEWTGYPVWGMRKEYFENISYHNWAVEEVLKRIANSLSPPKLVIWEFIQEMEHCAKLNKKTRNQFKVASKAAENMLDIVNAMEPLQIESWEKF